MKKFTALFSLLLIGMLLILTLPVQAAHPSFYFEKVCDSSIAPNICVIQGAVAPFDALNGGTIEYLDHAYFQNPAGVIIESATITVTASDGSQAVGHVRWVNTRGYFTLLPGTGSLENLHMSGMVNTISWETMTFSISGGYFYAP
jgi:hypothetical protein